MERATECCCRTKKVDMTPIRLEGDDDEEDGGDDDKEDEEDEDDESTPVPPSKRRTAACVSMLAFFAPTVQLTLRLLLETASSHGILKRKKAKTTMKTMHQSRPTRFWVLNLRVRKLRRWMDYWTTTSKRVVIIEVCDLFVVVTGLGRRVIFFSLRSSYRRICFVFVRAYGRHPVLRFAEPIRARVSISHTA
jgi:hypothetical protein